MTFHALDERLLQTERLKHMEHLSPEKRELVLKKLRERERKNVKGQNGSNLTPISHDPDNQYRPLSFSQQRLWFLQKLDPNNTAYNMPLAIRLTGSLNVTALEKSLAELVARHEILRTTFHMVKGEVSQQITPTTTWPLPLKSLPNISFAQQEMEIERLARQEAETPFDLAAGPLYRATLLRRHEREHILLLTLHHIICDGWSVNVLVQELGMLYAAFSQAKPISLPPLPIQFVDYARWQREWLTGDVLEKQLAYWEKQLAGVTGILDLATDYSRPPVQTFSGSVRRFQLDDSLLTRLKLLSRETQGTLFMTMLAAFATLLYWYSRQDDILIGTPIANRQHKLIEPLIGFFANTLVIRSRIQPDLTFRDLLSQVQQVALEAYAHQDMIFEKLLEELQLARNLSHSPLFQVMFAWQNTPVSTLTLADLTLEPLLQDHVTAKFDLTMGLIETGQSLTGWVEYNTDLFAAATIERLIDHYQTLLAGIVANPDRPIAQLPLLPVAEREQLLTGWNQTAVDYPETISLPQLVATQAEKTPAATAVIYRQQQLTYRQLEQQANQLAHHLQSLGVGPEKPVGICLSRSPRLLVALLAVLKAGGAYVPLDPDYPQERLHYMLADSQAQILLTEITVSTSLPNFSGAVVCLDSQAKEIEHYPVTAPDSKTTPEHLAYIIYTSGSTGRPKGVQISHGSLTNFLYAMRRQPGLQADDVLLPLTTISFDISILELFLPLTVGARIILGDDDLAGDAGRLAQALDRHGVTVMQATPVTWHLLLEGGWSGRPDLTMLCGGEAFSRDLANRLLAGGGRLWNMYGPTETTIWSAALEIFPGEDEVLIGRPIANTKIYLLNSWLKPVPIGVPGEIYLGGAGLARGYYNRPGITAERFIPHPFSSEPGARLYRTGDLARYRPDGNIEFLGRIDHQVKIRGFRIELGEIESVLADYPAVREVVVVAHGAPSGHKQLVAYCVPEGEITPTPKELRTFLRNLLPDYMLPVAFVNLTALPLTDNGKVDRAALPAPDAASSVTEKYVAPSTPTEVALAAIWSEVLGISQIGIHDNFFALGGHSLLTTQIIAQMEESFEVEIPIRNMFEYPTIAELSLSIEKLRWTVTQLSSMPMETDEEREEFVL